MEAIHPKYKTFWRRLFAGILDGIIISLPIIIIDFLFFYNVSGGETSVTKYLFSDDRTVGAGSFMMTVLHSIIVIAYSVYFTGFRGGTLGKMIMGITVLSGDDEASFIGIKRAAIRDMPYIVVECLGIVFIAMTGIDASGEDNATLSLLNNLIVIWFLAELITMFTNERRRAIHDILANSVVVKQVQEEVAPQ